MKKTPQYIMQQAALQLVAHKLFHEYLEISSSIKGVELEHYVEDWINKSLSDTDEEMNNYIWKCFLKNLLEYRREQKQ